MLPLSILKTDLFPDLFPGFVFDAPKIKLITCPVLIDLVEAENLFMPWLFCYATRSMQSIS
jgi:hypothetical protein